MAVRSHLPSPAEKIEKVERLVSGGRLRFELEELIDRCERHGTTPSLDNLRTLLDVTQE